MTDGTAPAIASKQANSTRIGMDKWSDYYSNLLSTQRRRCVGIRSSSTTIANHLT
jgi:4-hydroxyphenylpyruvate dioxygenase-like putative hemolysin